MGRMEIGEMNYSIGEALVFLTRKEEGGNCSCMASGLARLIVVLDVSEDILMGQ